MKTIIVSDKYDGKKINNIILSEFNELNINSLFKALRKKDIKVNNKRISENVIVHTNDKIEIYIPDKFFIQSSQNNSILKSPQLTADNIIYEDQNIIAVNKPLGIEVTRK